MTLCKRVPRAACSDSACGGIFCTNLTDAGQLMTRLAVLPPTTLE